MSKEPIELPIAVNDRERVTALLYPAAKTTRADVTLILGHGAGANQLHPFMRLFADGLALRGFDVMTFNFIYMEQGRHVPDQKAKLETCYRAVIEAAQKHKKLIGNRLAIGGKSMGGRIASQVAADAEFKVELLGLVFLGYPLHPPGKPEQLRDAHLKGVRAPMLFVQGWRDAFGTPTELQAVIQRLHLPATLNAIEGGDHSLKVSKGSPMTQPQVYESVMDKIGRWLSSRKAGAK